MDMTYIYKEDRQTLTLYSLRSWADPEGRGGGGGGQEVHPPLKITKSIGFHNNTAPDPLKLTKLPSKHSTWGYHRHASETPLNWRFAGVPIMAHLFGSHLPSSTKNKIKLLSKLDSLSHNFVDPRMEVSYHM